MTVLRISLLVTLYLLSVFSLAAFVVVKPFDLSTIESLTLANHFSYFHESDKSALTLEQAIDRFANTRNAENGIVTGKSNAMSLGIGVNPVWMKLRISNPKFIHQQYRYTIETPWLDTIDTWLVNNGQVTRHIKGGDGLTLDKQAMPYRYFAFETQFSKGITEIYIRIETIGPMVIPMRLTRVEQARNRDIIAGYEYGALYGVMLALALYNLVLFVLIRQKEYGLYSLYLLGFIANSLSYTGQIHGVINFDYGPYFQDWLDAFLMITYSVAGLHFARYLLNTASYSQKLDKFTCRLTIIIPLIMLICAAFNQLVLTLILAFILNSSFALLFIVLGFAALKAGCPSAKLFLISSVSAALCIGISTMAVGGILPYNGFTYKAIEVGMCIEAILLAVILAQQFRLAKHDKQIAEKYARADPLTGLYNRRGFTELADKVWQTAIRSNRNISIVLLDLDHCKRVNYNFGHQVGDKVLLKIAKCIELTIREGDISARWGGEEFIIILPETGQNEALIQAQRLRCEIAKLSCEEKNVDINITASFGVAGTDKGIEHYPSHQHVEGMIKQADDALYIAKGKGRNCVYYADNDDAKHNIQPQCE
jgi:diguanylate cyclase (GGDEF)-like protein